MVRALFAGDVGRFTYAGQLGVHVRPLDDAPTPGSPRGSELLFGVAGGREAARAAQRWNFVVGPEIYGATAFRSFFGATGTAWKGSSPVGSNETGAGKPQLRVKLGVGGGLNPHFGAPEWRLVFAIEVFHRGGT